MKSRNSKLFFIILMITSQFIVSNLNSNKKQNIPRIVILECNKNEKPSFCYFIDKKIKNYITQLTNKSNRILDSEFNVTCNMETMIFTGYNLFILKKTHLDNMSYRDIFLMATDLEGKIILKKDLGSSRFGGALDVEFINSTTILTAKPEGVAIWNLFSNNFIELGIQGHHEYEYNYSNHTLLTLDEIKHNMNGKEYQFDKIVEYNISTRKIIWELDTSSFVDPDQWCPHQDLTQTGLPDITHCNTIFFDDEEDVFYLNARNLNTFYKISHKTGEIIWGLGEYGNFTLYDRFGGQRNNLFYHAHAVEKVDDNTFILFDNDYHNQSNSLNQRSQILEITIDETTMTANESWSWTAPLQYYSGFVSDADRLPNGNRLGVFGTERHPYTDIGPRLVEVNDKGQIVWEMNFPHSEEFLFEIYRADRFYLSPILNIPSDIIVLHTNIATVCWNTWYNFRNKNKFPGNFCLYLNDTIIETGSFFFKPFWRPTDLIFKLKNLRIGTYNLTLSVSNEAGHIITDSINITVRSDQNLNKDLITKNKKRVPLSFFTLIIGIFILTVWLRRNKN
ncbi:MAG: aryl-sulfate sulfotransferase [Candidatus Hodarchaeota archaeon]